MNIMAQIMTKPRGSIPCIVSNAADALVDRRFVDELSGNPSLLEIWRDPCVLAGLAEAPLGLCCSAAL
jgi:hypothetical protein